MSIAFSVCSGPWNVLNEHPGRSMGEQPSTPELDGESTNVKPPISIFRISSGVDRYFVYDADTALWLRGSQRILGVLTGSLPQFPQQNVFQGLPLELQSEEVRLLFDSGLALVVDDSMVHSENMHTLGTKDYAHFMSDLGKQGAKLARISAAAKERKTLQHRHIRGEESAIIDGRALQSPQNENSLFDSSSICDRDTKSRSSPLGPSSAYSITPATSYPPYSDTHIKERRVQANGQSCFVFPLQVSLRAVIHAITRIALWVPVPCLPW